MPHASGSADSALGTTIVTAKPSEQKQKIAVVSTSSAGGTELHIMWKPYAAMPTPITTSEETPATIPAAMIRPVR